MAALAADGYTTVAEPGRRIIAEERVSPTGALPWEDPLAFAQRAMDMAERDLVACRDVSETVFFDRGILDAVVALCHHTKRSLATVLPDGLPYTTVFLAEPWEALFTNDADRPHGFSEAVAEYNRICAALVELKVQPEVLPQSSVTDRVAFVKVRVADKK